jgi:hypothetical protein
MSNTIQPKFDFSDKTTPAVGSAHHEDLENIPLRRKFQQNALKAEIFSEYERLFQQIADIIGTVPASRNISDWIQLLLAQSISNTVKTDTIAKTYVAQLGYGILGPMNGDIPTGPIGGNIGGYDPSDIVDTTQQELRIINNSDTTGIILQVYPGTAFTGITGIDILQSAMGYTLPSGASSAIEDTILVTEEIQVQDGTTVQLSGTFLVYHGITEGEFNGNTIGIGTGGGGFTENSSPTQYIADLNLTTGALTFNTGIGYSVAATKTVTYRVYAWRRDLILLHNLIPTNEVLYLKGEPATNPNDCLLPVVANTDYGVLYEVLKTPRQSPDQNYNTPQDNLSGVNFNVALPNHQIIRLLPRATTHDEKNLPEDNCVVHMNYEHLLFYRRNIYMKEFGVKIKGHYYHIRPTVLTIPVPSAAYGTTFVYATPYAAVETIVVEDAHCYPAYPMDQTDNGVPEDSILIMAVRNTPSDVTLSNDNIIPLWHGPNMSRGMNITEGCEISTVMSAQPNMYGLGITHDVDYPDTICTITGGKLKVRDVPIITPEVSFTGGQFIYGDNTISLDPRNMTYQMVNLPSGSYVTTKPYEICTFGRKFFPGTTNYDIYPMLSMHDMVIPEKSHPYSTHIVSVAPGTGPITVEMPHSIRGAYIAQAHVIGDTANIVTNNFSYLADPGCLTIGVQTRHASEYTQLAVTLIELNSDIQYGTVKAGDTVTFPYTADQCMILAMPVYSSEYAYYGCPYVSLSDYAATFNDDGFSDDSAHPVNNYWMMYAIIPSHLYTTVMESTGYNPYTVCKNYSWMLPYLEMIETTLGGTTPNLVFFPKQVTKTCNSSKLYVGTCKGRS